MKLVDGNHIGSDTETTGLDTYSGDRPYCFSFCNFSGDTEVVYFPVNPKTREVIYDERLEKIRAYYEDPNKTFYFHNAAFDVRMLRAVNINIKGKVVCTMSLIRLIRSDAPLKLKEFCSKFLGIPEDDETELREATRAARLEARKKGYAVYDNPKKKSEEDKLAPDYWLAGPKFYVPYAKMDAVRVVAVAYALLPEIKKTGIESLWNTELHTWEVLRKIEQRGVCIDKTKVLNAKINIKKKLQIFEQKIKKLTQNSQLNFRSHKQLSQVLYEKLKEPVRFLTARGQQPSTDNGALRLMTNPVASAVLNARACTKTMEFMDQYLRFMVRHADGAYYLHPNFHSSVAVTGRESCSDPNLQQVAKGKDEKLEVRVEARSVFIPRAGYRMRSYDWRNIEVYIPAFESGDKRLVKMLKAGEDVHAFTAKDLTKRVGGPLARTEEDARDIAKRTFFGLQYGIGAYKMSKTLGISTELAERIITAFSETYPGLWEWMQDLMRTTRRDGYIKTKYGRKIFVKPEEAYKGINYFVQGTAGGILKNAKNKISDMFEKKDAHIVLPIHDELLNEYGESVSIEKMDRAVVGAMQDNPELNMPVKIPVSISAIGKNWSEKSKITVM